MTRCSGYSKVVNSEFFFVFVFCGGGGVGWWVMQGFCRLKLKLIFFISERVLSFQLGSWKGYSSLEFPCKVVFTDLVVRFSLHYLISFNVFFLLTYIAVGYLPKTQVSRLRQTVRQRLSFVSNDDISCWCSQQLQRLAHYIPSWFHHRFLRHLRSKEWNLKLRCLSQWQQTTASPSSLCQSGFSSSYHQSYHELLLANHQEGEAEPDNKKQTTAGFGATLCSTRTKTSSIALK